MTVVVRLSIQMEMEIDESASDRTRREDAPARSRDPLVRSTESGAAFCVECEARFPEGAPPPVLGPWHATTCSGYRLAGS